MNSTILSLNNTNPNYWSPLTCLVEEQEFNNNIIDSNESGKKEVERVPQLEDGTRRGKKKRRKKKQVRFGPPAQYQQEIPPATNNIVTHSPSSPDVAVNCSNDSNIAGNKVHEEDGDIRKAVDRADTVQDKLIKSCIRLASQGNELPDVENDNDGLAVEEKRNEEMLSTMQRELQQASAIFHSGASSGVATEKDAKLMIRTGEPSHKTFVIPNSETMAATEKVKLPFQLREPANEMNVVPGVHTSLISASKMADAGYITILDKDELNIYDSTTTTIALSKKAMLKGYRCTQSGLWRIPLKDKVQNENTDTILMQRPSASESICHVFELPSTKKTIVYYHACAGFPTQETWLRAICAGNYDTWPGLTASSAAKHFPEHDEEKKGHMKGQRQGI